MTIDWFLNIRILVEFWKLLQKRDFVLGEAVQKFETNLKEYLGMSFVYGVANGTDALILSLKAAGINPGDEVIVPAIGFISTASSVSWIGARPVFVDIAFNDGMLDHEKAEEAITKKTRAIIVTHLNGKIADLEHFFRLRERFGIPIIIDAAHAFGAMRGGQKPSKTPDIVCLSFNFTKMFGAYGDAGAVMTNDASLAKKLSLMRLYGAEPGKIHSQNTVIGVASRLDPFQATILNVKFPSLKKMVEAQKRNYEFYLRVLNGIKAIDLPFITPSTFTNWYRFTMKAKRRDELAKYLSSKHLPYSIYYSNPLPFMPVFENLQYKKEQFPNSVRYAESTITLPTHYSLGNNALQRVARAVCEFYAS